MRTLKVGLESTPRMHVRGNGYFAGESPAVPSDPESPDGRARILNVPSRVRVVIYERGMLPVAEVLSAADGTWRVDHLDRSLPFTICGFVGESVGVNAAIQDWVRSAPMV
jgi:hypothetical protein